METLIGVAAWGFAFGAGWTLGGIIARCVFNGIALGVRDWWRS